MYINRSRNTTTFNIDTLNNDYIGCPWSEHLPTALTCVLADVVNKVFLSGERFGAEAASVWRLTRVLANVVQEMFLSRERLRAEITAVRRLARMPHYVVREVLLPRKRLTCISQRWTEKSIENRCASLDCNTRGKRFIYHRHITNRMIGTIPRHVVVRN